MDRPAGRDGRAGIDPRTIAGSHHRPARAVPALSTQETPLQVPKTPALRGKQKNTLA
jgi:hypothetical protein